MTQRMTKAEAKAWKARWKAVNEAEIAEWRRTPKSVSSLQLAVLMASAERMGWMEALEESLVRERWNRLRRAYGTLSKKP